MPFATQNLHGGMLLLESVIVGETLVPKLSLDLRLQSLLASLWVRFFVLSVGTNPIFIILEYSRIF